jgi:hypothetical protein
VHNILGGAGVIQESHRERQQAIQVFLVDALQSIPAAALEFPLKHFVFYDHLQALLPGLTNESFNR